MRRPIVAGNWKMNKTAQEAVALVVELKELVSDVKDVEIVLCPPFTALEAVSRCIEGSDICLGAQDMFWEKSGPYTGEVSAEMLLTLGCKYVILGHSERRTHFGETNQTVNRKVKTALESGLVPIVCVGERLEERRSGDAKKVVEDQVTRAFDGVPLGGAERAVVAYEPVWAIGTGLTATPDQAQEVHSHIRQILAELYNAEVAEGIRIQYGGSIKPENARDLFAQQDIDGGLVGGASLKAESFAGIIRGAQL
ncbi:MAG TPA: triose-phosphate isomerase [Candidatus Latescibacteria bacterium]|nr:triose-phosphate isomerase [Candidatus Latescibacterota bacterium]